MLTKKRKKNIELNMKQIGKLLVKVTERCEP